MPEAKRQKGVGPKAQQVNQISRRKTLATVPVWFLCSLKMDKPHFQATSESAGVYLGLLEFDPTHKRA